jgi:hypothetical protein
VLGFGAAPKQSLFEFVVARETTPMKVRDRGDALADTFATANLSCGGRDVRIAAAIPLASDGESSYE